MNPALQVLSIPTEDSFLGTLAAWILERFGDDLVWVRVLLPNRRACRALRETLLNATGGKPMLLPRIQPIGDLENENLPADIVSAELLRELPPVISSDRRLLLLTRLVLQFEKQRGHYNMAQAVQLARQLARCLDDIAREGLRIDALPMLVPGELAMHWQETLDFLHIISVHWPQTLKDEAVIDRVDHRNRLLKGIANTWQINPPTYPVIAAGSTGTQPATAGLLARIARLPKGYVILPGLDKTMPENEWEQIAPTHPQYALKGLLKHIGLARYDVNDISLPPTGGEDRVKCLRTIFQPAAVTAGWLQANPPFMLGLKNVHLFETDTLMDEARLISIALRETLEIPEKTAALVTPDRTLARMVAAQMQRFGISIDDSAGRPVLDTPMGVFMRLTAELCLSPASSIQLLSVLRHPLAALGLEPAQCRSLSRILDKEYLRGVRLEPGLIALCKSIKPEHHELRALLDDLKKKMQLLSPSFLGSKKIAPVKLLKEHIALAEWLASAADETGGKRLWAGDMGAQLAEMLTILQEHMKVLPDIEPVAYPGIFETLLAEEVYRPSYSKHPRLHILSPIEARLLRYDRVILGSLNEDVWPARPAADPWMSRPMREAFGLPAAEHSIGQSAHDVFQLCAAPEVFLTRARKAEGVPTVPSRWLVRLETLLKGKDAKYFAELSDSADYERAKQFLETPMELPPLERPQPKPPLAARPRRMNATAIETWQRDPYMIYARHVLGLKALLPIDQEPGAADFGILVHDALKRFSDKWPSALPDDVVEALLVSGREAFAEFLDRPSVAALWWPRYEAMASWLSEQEKTRRIRGIQILSEREGNLPLAVDDLSFTLTTRIDRMEMNHSGQAVIIDYKTGSLPTSSDIEKGLAAQLPIEALIATEGSLNPPLPTPITLAGLEYWRLAGREDQCEIKSLGTPEEIVTLLQACRENVIALVRQYNDPAQPFAAPVSPAALPRYNDYAHITRRQEWGEA